MWETLGTEEFIAQNTTMDNIHNFYAQNSLLVLPSVLQNTVVYS